MRGIDAIRGNPHLLEIAATLADERRRQLTTFLDEIAKSKAEGADTLVESVGAEIEHQRILRDRIRAHVNLLKSKN